MLHDAISVLWPFGQATSANSKELEMRRLVLYSTGECTQSRRLVSLLSKAKLKFEEADATSQDSRLKLESMGISGMGSPLLVMDDNPLRFLGPEDINSMADKSLLALIR